MLKLPQENEKNMYATKDAGQLETFACLMKGGVPDSLSSPS